MRYKKIWWGRWWRLGKLCEVSRCLVWRELRHHCLVYNVSYIFFSKCLYFSYYVSGYILDRPHMYLHKTRCILFPLIPSPLHWLVWRGPHCCAAGHLCCLASALGSRCLATKLHLARLPVLPSGTEEGRVRDATQAEIGAVLLLPACATQYSIPTFPPAGKPWPIPEIGRLCFHSSLRGHTLAFFLSFDSLFCILDL